MQNPPLTLKHKLVLLELGILDDIEDWELYQQQEARFAEIDGEIDAETWHKYVLPLQQPSKRRL